MLYRFGDSELDTARFELRRNGVSQPIEPQVYSLLLYLIQNRQRVVTRDELLAAIWHERVVTDAALNSRVKSARSAIGDDGHSQAQIRTVQRRGYRFVAQVAEVPATAANGPRGADVAQIIASEATADAIDLTLPSQPSVAVLPLLALGERRDQLLADGLTHDIISGLARARWLFVVARGSAFKFRSGPYEARDVGSALGVRYVAQGDVNFASTRVSVRVVLSDAIEGKECWTETFRCGLNEMFAVQDEIVDLIAGSIESEIEQLERERARLRPPASLDAWAAYHRGCWHMYRFTAADYDQAERFFHRSAELDPSSPRALAGLSFVHWQRAFLELTGDREAEIVRSFMFARQAYALDPRDPLGHWALGRAYLLRRDVDQAVDELETAVSLNPNSAMGQYSLGYALMQAGVLERSADVCVKARRLSPYDPMAFGFAAVRGQSLVLLGRYDEGATLTATAARQPHAHYYTFAIAAYCNVLAGRNEPAKEFYSRLLVLRPDYSVEQFFRAFAYRREQDVALIEGALKQAARLV